MDLILLLQSLPSESGDIEFNAVHSQLSLVGCTS